MAVVGSAEVIVRAITTKVRDDIQKAFKDAQPAIQAAGRDAAKNFAGAFNQTLEQRLGPTMESTFRKAAADAGEGAVEEIGNRLSDLDRPADDAGRRVGQALRRGLGNGSNGNELNGLLGSLYSVASAGESLGGAMQGASTGLTTLIATGNFAGAALSGLAGAASVAVSGLFAMVSAASQAAGALAVLPGILSVVGQAFGVLKLAFGGVGTALQAGAKAQAAATSATGAGAKAAKVSAAQARAQQKAQDALTAAQKAATEAQKELNKAQKLAADGADEQRLAQTLLNDAQRKRNETLADPNATATDGANAQRAVDTAEQANTAITRSRKKALKDLQDAEEKNAKAQDELAKAQADRDKLTNKAGVGAAGAMSPAIKAANAYQDALAKLSPQAQEFVKKLLAMKDTFHQIGLLVQEEFFKPINDGLDTLIDSQFFPILRQELPITGRILGQIGKQILTTFSNTTNMTRFQKILEGNNDILKVFKTRTSDGETPVQALVNLFMKLLQAIQPITKRFAVWVGQMLTAWDTSKKFGSEKGMERFFQRAGDTAAQLGDIIGNLMGALFNLGGAAQTSGHDLLDSFEEATQKFQDWTKKVSDDGTAGTYFDQVSTNLKAIGDLINTIGADFAGLADNPGIANLAKNLQPAVDNVFKMFDNFNGNGDTIGKFAEQVSKLILAFTDSNGINLFFQTLTKILDVLNTILGLPGVKQGLGVAAGFMAISRAIKFATGLGGMFISDISKNFKNTIGLAGKLSKSISQMFRGNFKDAFKTLFGKTDTSAQNSQSQQQGETAGEAFAKGLADGLRGAEPQIIAAIDSVIDKIHDEAIAGAQLMDDIGRDTVKGFVQGINAEAPQAVVAINNLSDDVIDALKTKLGIHSPSVVMDRLGQNTGEGYVQGLRSEIDDAYKAGAAIGDAAADGARTARVVPNVATTAAAPAANAAANSVDLTPAVIGAGSASKAVDDVAKKSGKLSGAFGKVGGAVKGLGGGLLALTGGPFGLLLTTLPLIIAGFTALYKKSPEFRKFVDGIVKAVKPFIEMVGKVLIKILNNFFAWINDHMPEIKKIFSDVFEVVGEVVSVAFDIIQKAWSYVLQPVLSAIMKIIPVVVKVIVTYVKIWMAIFQTAFTVIKGLWEKVLRPVFDVIVSVVGLVWKGIKTYIGLVVTVIRTEFAIIKGIWDKVLHPVFSAVVSVARSVFGAVGTVVSKAKDGISAAFSGIQSVWDKVLKPVFNTVKSVGESTFNAVKTVIEGVGTAFGSMKSVISKAADGLGAIFDKVKTAAKTPIKWVVDTVWNGGIVAFANKIPEVSLEKVDTSGWAEGGWTGSGGKYDVAGLVHRDEFVIQKSSRRIFERLYPGLLDAINKTGKLPQGHSSGGLVKGAYSGNVPSTYQSLRGYGLGGLVDDIGDGFKNVGKGVLNLGGDTIKWTGNIVKGGYNWTKDKVTAAYDAVKNVIDWLKNLPSNIINNMNGTEWGKLFMGIPRAAANKTVDYINGLVPDIVPGIPLGAPFPGVNFRALGGRVFKGSPYIVGEKRPELFIPDQTGTIVPNLGSAGAQQALLSVLQSTQGSVPLNAGTTNNTVNSGSRSLTVNVHNPTPERTSQSTTRVIRSKAIAAGWSV